MQMTIYGSEGQVETERGPLRVVTLPSAVGSPVQVLVTNEGVASGLLTLSCRADQPERPVAPAPVRPELTPPLPNPVRQPDPAPVPVPGPDQDIPTEPVPDSATGAPMQPEPLAPTEQPSTERPSIQVPLVPDDQTQ